MDVDSALLELSKQYVVQTPTSDLQLVICVLFSFSFFLLWGEESSGSWQNTLYYLNIIPLINFAASFG